MEFHGIFSFIGKGFAMGSRVAFHTISCPQSRNANNCGNVIKVGKALNGVLT